MAHHKSAKKRIRQTATRTELNKAKKSAARSAIKQVRTAVASGNKEDALKHFRVAQSLLARMAKSGIIKAGNSSRNISRLAGHISKL